jgi:zinc protease
MNLLPLVLSFALAGSAAPAGSSAAPKLPVEQYRLENGLTVVLSEDHQLPVVAVEVLYRVGSGHERAGRTGFAHLFEHLMFQGSEHFDQEYFKPYEPIGGAVNGTTNRDRTNFFERVPSNYLELPLWLESDRMQNLLPSLSQQKLDNQRDVVKNERRQRYENAPYGMVWEYLGDAMYPPGHPYRHTPIGSHEDLTAATLDDVKGFFEQYYVPQNAVVTLVGDFKSADAKALVARYFGSIPAGQAAPAPQAALPQPTGIVHLVKEDNVKLPRVYLAWHTPALFAAGDAELDLFSNVLSDGKTSRLFYPLVYDKKIAKDVEAFQMSQKLSSVYVIQATAAPGQTVDALYDALLANLNSALATPPSGEELTRSINAYKKGFYERVEGVQSRASLLATYVLHTGSADYLQQDLARYTQATPASVHAAARQWLDPKAFVRLDIVPGASGASAPVTAPPPGPTPPSTSSGDKPPPAQPVKGVKP